MEVQRWIMARSSLPADSPRSSAGVVLLAHEPFVDGACDLPPGGNCVDDEGGASLDVAAGIGLIHPWANPRSTICNSICLMVTGWSLILSVQAASHGAGQSRPVISGKLSVECRLWQAWRQRPR